MAGAKRPKRREDVRRAEEGAQPFSLSTQTQVKRTVVSLWPFLLLYII